jgi:hypothetical protein
MKPMPTPSNPAPNCPRITIEPRDQTVLAGFPALFALGYFASQPVQIQWYRDGTPLSGETRIMYAFRGTGLKDDGALFNAEVSGGGCAIKTRSALLRVQAPPAPFFVRMVQGPRTAEIGKPMRLKVVAKGKGLKYQWYRNGTPLRKGTSQVLRLGRLTTEEADSLFDVVITDRFGQQTAIYGIQAKVRGGEASQAKRKPSS